MNERFDVIVTILELIGTAAFAASGALTAIKRRFDLFGVIIIGVTTAGGGVLRDIFVNKKPEIFVGNIYACASATGAAAFLLCYGMMSFMPACMVSLAVTFSLRLMSVKFGWNLPKIQIKARQERRIAATKENLINKKGA